MNTANPDVLHPLKAYAVILEAALGIRHDARIEKLLRDQRIPIKRWDALDFDPIAVDPILTDTERTDKLVTELDQDFARIFQSNSRHPNTFRRQLRVLSDVYGLEDGKIHSLEELAALWGVTRNTANTYRDYGLNGVKRFLENRHSIEISLTDWGASRLALAQAVRASLLP